MSKGEQTRTAIIDTALAMTTSVGLEGLTLSRLAKLAGMSKSGLFAHFDSKQALQLEVLQTAAERFKAIVIGPALALPRGEPRLRGFVDNWLDWERSTFQPGGCIFVATTVELDDKPGPLRDALVTLQSRWIEALRRTAEMGVEEGHFSPTLDCDQFAYDLYAIILGYHLFRRLLHDRKAETKVRTSFERLLENARP